MREGRSAVRRRAGRAAKSASRDRSSGTCCRRRRGSRRRRDGRRDARGGRRRPRTRPPGRRHRRCVPSRATGSTAVERTRTGRPVSSARRPATRPMMPTGQSPSSTMKASSVGSVQASPAPPRWLSRSAPGAGGWRPRAGRRAAAAVGVIAASSSAAATAGSPTRPMALMRGARPKEMSSGRHVIRVDAAPTASRAARPGRGASLEPAQAEAHDGAVLAVEGHDVRDRPDGRQVRQPERGLGAARRVRQEQLRDLEGDPGAGEPTVRIAAVRAVRVDEGDGVRQRPGPARGGR